MKYKTKQLSLLLACSVSSQICSADIAENAILVFKPGYTQCGAAGDEPGPTPPATCLYSITDNGGGSWFTMDQSNIGVIDQNEYNHINPQAGLALGISQPASGSHTGGINGTENPSIDEPWTFFGNTGMTQSTKPITVLTDDGAGNVTLDMEGLSVTWNGIADIPVGGCHFGDPIANGVADTCNKDGTVFVDTGIGTLKCYSSYTDDGFSNTFDYSGLTDCVDGVYFVLDHSAHIPVGDPSNFGGVPYGLHLEGTILVPPKPVSAEGIIDGGSVSGLGSDTRVSMTDLVAAGIPEDRGYAYNGGLYDFINTGVTANADIAIVIFLTAPIPEEAVYRKFINSNWTTVTDDANNWVASAAKTGGNCPAPNDAAYVKGNGLTPGHGCVQITIQDNGIYDADVSTTNIADPGGVATPVEIFEDTRTSGNDGCSMSGTSAASSQHADWWIVGGFLTLLGIFTLRKNKV